MHSESDELRAAIARYRARRADQRYAQPLILVNIVNFFKCELSLKLLFSGLYEGSGGYRKLGEACSKNFHLVAPLKTGTVTSYNQKAKELHDYEHHDY